MEPLTVGLAVFAIILCSGAALLGYIFLIMKYGSRSKTLLKKQMQVMADDVHDRAAKIFKTWPEADVERIRDQSLWKERERIVSSLIVSHKILPNQTDVIVSALMFRYFGGYIDYNYR